MAVCRPFIIRHFISIPNQVLEAVLIDFAEFFYLERPTGVWQWLLMYDSLERESINERNEGRLYAGHRRLFSLTSAEYQIKMVG